MSSRPTHIRWNIFLIFAFASFTSYALRGNLSIAAPTIIGEYGFTEIQWGWVVAAFTTGYAIFQFPGGVFSDKVGPRKALTLIAILWSVFTVIMVLLPGADAISVVGALGLLIVAQFLYGVSNSPVFPTINSIVARWFPVGRWALPLGLSSTGLTLGIVVSAPVLSYLIVEWGWRTGFLVMAPLGILVSAIWWTYGRDTPAEHRSVNEAELALITEKQVPDVAVVTNPPGWARVLKNRNVILLTLSYSCMCFIFYSVFSWFPYYVMEVRLFEQQATGFVTSSQWLAGAAGAALGGWLCTQLCNKLGLRWGSRWPILIGMVMSAVLLVIGAYHQNPLVAVSMLALCFFFNQITEAAYWSTSVAVGGQLAGAAGGVMNTGANAMGVINALLMPRLAEAFGWTIALSSGAVFVLVGALLMLFVKADEPVAFD